MMSTKLINAQIKKIINLFNYDKNFKFWKIKTKITSIIDNFNNNYKIIKKEKRTDVIDIVKENNLYRMLCNSYNVTPSEKVNHMVSSSTIRQYLDVLGAFNIIEKINDKKYKIIDKEILSDNPMFDSVIYSKKIINNFNNLNNIAKKLFFSILITYICSLCEEDFCIDLPTSKKQGKITKNKILEYAKACGYNFLTKEFYFFGSEIEDIYENIMKLINKK